MNVSSGTSRAFLRWLPFLRNSTPTFSNSDTPAPNRYAFVFNPAPQQQQQQHQSLELPRVVDYEMQSSPQNSLDPPQVQQYAYPHSPDPPCNPPYQGYGPSASPPPSSSWPGNSTELPAHERAQTGQHDAAGVPKTPPSMMPQPPYGRPLDERARSKLEGLHSWCSSQARPPGVLAPSAPQSVDVLSQEARYSPPPALQPTPPEITVEDVDNATSTTQKPIAVPPSWERNPPTLGLDPPVDQVPLESPGLVPPITNLPMSTPDLSAGTTDAGAYDTERPFCSLNLVCYRGGTRGCVLKQLQTVLASRFADVEVFKITLAKNSQLIATDRRFFKELRRLYSSQMSGFWRRYFSLKTLTGLRLLAYSPSTRPAVVPLDDLILQEMFYAYEHPESVHSQTEWIEWVFRLRRRDKRHALEFVEGWNSTRVIIAGMLPWLFSCIVGVAWTAAGKDTQTAFTVASFILTSGTVILALLAVISGIESSGRRHSPLV
ncbi:hypothetical protein DM02DRAFT_728436 [Periconia macrospinosa]|uniref:Transmembrane protein n=1 Tax=Periconia macrospinosa TaxID=97972 RepID=A0A2V1DTS8_9PLEO|nr:hypothetical protein DM02DRAFT_728436 [Periconia macrospinosa]